MRATKWHRHAIYLKLTKPTVYLLIYLLNAWLQYGNRVLWAAKTKFSGVYYSDTNTFRKFEANSYSIPKKNWKSFSNWPSFLITSNRKSLLLHIDFKKNRFPVFAITEHLPWSWLLPNNWFYSNSVQLLFPKYCLSSLKWVDKISK